MAIQVYYVCGRCPQCFFYLLDCHATDVARNDKWEDCCAPSPAMTRIGCELHTDLSSRGSVTTVAIQVYYVCGRCPQCFFYLLDCHATDVARNDKWEDCCAPSPAMTRIGCELHTDLSSRGSVTTVAIQVYYVCGRCPQCFFIYWIATPSAMVRNDKRRCRASSLAMTSGKIGVCPPHLRNDKWGGKCRTSKSLLVL